MSLNNLRNYNWEQGTLSNPVSLTGTQFGWLINLLKKGTVTKDIRGYIQVGSPITSYEKYLVELAKDENNQPLLHLVNPTVTPVEYTVVPQASTIKEGTSTKLNINGIGLEALKFRIVNHTNTIPDYQERTTIDTELGYVRVAPAKENTTWTDVVTIQTCPVWEEWTDEDASIVEFDVTVNAVAVTSVTITAPQYVKPGVTFNPIVNFLPVGHTKPLVNTLEDASAKKGICFIPTSDDFSVGKTTDPTKMSAIAPNTETPAGETWSLGCGVYAFTNTQTIATPSVNVAVKYPYIQFTVTTDGTFSDISAANPKITLQKVNSQDEPIGEPVVLIGTVSGSSLVYTYGNGNVAGDGSETYKVSIDKISMYSAHYTNTIIPNGVISNYTINYGVIEAEIGIIYDDGTKQSKEEYYTTMSFIANKTVVGVYIETDDTKFIVDTENANNTYLYGLGGYNQTISELPSFTIEEALLDFNGKLRTNQMAMGSNGVVAAMRAMQQITSTINGTPRKAFYAAGGQAKLIAINFSFIVVIAKLRSYTSVSDSDSKNYASPNRIDSSRAFFNAKKNESISIQNGLAFPCFGLEYDVNYDVVE